MITAPSGEEIRGGMLTDGEKSTPINMGKYLRENKVGRESLLTTTVTAMAGQTEQAVNVGDELVNLNGVRSTGVRSTYGVFEQFTYGAELTTEAWHNTFLSLRTAHVSDDPKSIYDAGVTEPLQNTVLSAGAEHLFGAGNMNVDGEIAYSLYDENTLSTLKETKNDIAYRLRYRWNKNPWDVMFAYESIGSKFDLGGNLSIRSIKDRKGPRFRIAHKLNNWDWITLRVRGNHYRDNLDQDKPFTTKTFDGGAFVDPSLPSNLRLSLGYTSRLDWSNRASDTGQTIQQVNTRTGGIRLNAVWSLFNKWSLFGLLFQFTYEKSNHLYTWSPNRGIQDPFRRDQRIRPGYIQV